MRPSIKKRWLAALRSGKYKKGKNRLKNNNKYCCLGVLCDIMKPSIKRKFNITDSDTLRCDGNKSTLSSEFREYLHIEDCFKLWNLNDTTETFDEVISYIKVKL